MSIPTTLRGQEGLMALGGHLIGSPFINGTVSALATTMNIDNNGSGTLTGVSGPGDVFTVGVNSYTVTSVYKVATANAITGITFTPGAIGGFADNAAITYHLNSLANLREWTLSPVLDVLDTSIMRNVAHTNRSGFLGWTGTGQVLLDYDDVQQAAVINKAMGGSPDGTTAALLFGMQDGHPRDAYGAATLRQMQVQGAAIGSVFMVTFAWDGNDIVLLNYV